VVYISCAGGISSASRSSWRSWSLAGRQAPGNRPVFPVPPRLYPRRAHLDPPPPPPPQRRLPHWILTSGGRWPPPPRSPTRSPFQLDPRWLHRHRCSCNRHPGSDFVSHHLYSSATWPTERGLYWRTSHYSPLLAERLILVHTHLARLLHGFVGWARGGRPLLLPLIAFLLRPRDCSAAAGGQEKLFVSQTRAIGGPSAPRGTTLSSCFRPVRANRLGLRAGQPDH